LTELAFHSFRMHIKSLHIISSPYHISIPSLNTFVLRYIYLCIPLLLACFACSILHRGRQHSLLITGLRSQTKTVVKCLWN